ncbi:hypothetical protein P171DRAFT_117792 [Karstenula rhodostoma CBS 690.94]|uniref:Uncharacterized protein n=1 Tax=Karstenula rhodostoma CBS 690.94 TaxID=1392251 RepID=A0A9P4P9T8_9PLEO|nr:hypothetical protein P171DRAFT_117792 [Karstenula rhodostoma CBS 690.94]
MRISLQTPLLFAKHAATASYDGPCHWDIPLTSIGKGSLMRPVSCDMVMATRRTNVRLTTLTREEIGSAASRSDACRLVEDCGGSTKTGFGEMREMRERVVFRASCPSATRKLFVLSAHRERPRLVPVRVANHLTSNCEPRTTTQQASNSERIAIALCGRDFTSHCERHVCPACAAGQ